MMPPGGHRPVFFVHVMKTGGSSFLRHVADNLPGDAIYPHTLLSEGVDEDLREAYVSVADLLALPEEQRRRIRFYSGHMPAVVASMIGVDEVVTVLRDPVDRTVSLLRQLLLTPGRDFSSIEEVYDDAWWFLTLIRNYQSKLFAMGADETEASERAHWEPIEMDDARLERAKATLDGVAVLGLQEDYPAFVEEARRRYGWDLGAVSVHRDRVSRDHAEVPRSLLARITRDNEVDIEFYRHAQSLHSARRSGGMR